MTPEDRFLHRLNWAVLAFVVGTAIFCAAGCAFLKAIGRTATVAGGAAGGAAVGSVGGPPGMVAGGALGGGATYAMLENSELREGSLQGEGAREEENKRLKSLLLIANGDLQLKERALAAKEEAIRAALDQVDETKSYFEGTKRFWVRVILIGFVTRNLMVLWELGRCLRRKKWWLAAKWFGHLFHPWRPKTGASE